MESFPLKKQLNIEQSLCSDSSKYCTARSSHKTLNMWVTGETVWQCFPCNVPSLAKAVNNIMTQHFVTAGSLTEECQPIQAWFFVCLFPPLPNIWKLMSWLIGVFTSSTTASLFLLTDSSFARNRQNINVNYSKSLFHAVMGETLGDSLIDPESDSFADTLSASTSQGKVHSRYGCWDTLGIYGRLKLLL